MTFRLLHLPALVLAVALLLVGCDSGVTPGTETGTDTPTVEFASSSVGAAPDDTVSVDVVLNNPDGNAVSVDVLFAEPASSASPDDVNGLMQSDVQTVSFPAGAADGATQSVEVVLTADITDGQKTARFALQNLQTEGTATLGSTKEFAINVGPEAIASALDKGVGASVTIQGTVTRAFGSYARIQDDSGELGASGITIRQTFGDLSGDFQGAISNGTIEAGTELLVTGTISAFSGLFQINNTDLTSFTIVEQGNAPDPLEISVSEAASGDYLSLLVRIPDVQLASPPTTFSGGTTYTLTDGEGSEVPFRVQGGDESNVGGTPAPQGTFTYEGVMGTFNGAQVLPILPSDIVGGDDGNDGGGSNPSAVSLAEARNLADDEPVVFEAVLTRGQGRYLFFQDETAGLQLFDFDGFNSQLDAGELAIGDEVRVSGTMGTFNDQRQVSDATLEVLSSGNDLPAVQTITLDELNQNGADYEHELVRVEDFTIDAGGDTVFQAGGGDGNYDIDDGTATGVLRLEGSNSSEYEGESIPSGDVTFEGVVTQFNGTYQLHLALQSDLIIP